MKNSNQNPSPGKKVNQIIFVEYQRPTEDGHLITVTDSYRNTLGRIHRSFNEQTKKYDFVAYDHSGKPISTKSDKVWELKNHFSDNSKQLLEDAHQRRIESKKKETNDQHENNKATQGDTKKSNREQELDEIREKENGKEDRTMER